jgi:DNA-binding FadR family transcriptional regulator
MAKKNGKLKQAVEADLRFHRAVMRAAHNPYLELVLDPVMSVFLQQIKLTNFNKGLEMHRQVFQEIKARNTIGARQAVRRLMKATLNDSRQALKKFRQ